ncbi:MULTISPECIES: AAA family ATPase [unclassified Nostoc]|uniref:trifunctional serine/threonine-protein kinase/ATP-binding protein/sensor histidine kinase n=1 Tax=unclassified Nostoc TaxID=2593658 RepID=UPI002AD2B990|nr:AAA family ATPase [Nostoc sp. DedQUE03]MDZ7974235.1 AAA family ATPase [Nostoc sp. DedQUE03]MDZ8042891.1 AAA family ATPase [Nostoc sp. DedQUE02]
MTTLAAIPDSNPLPYIPGYAIVKQLYAGSQTIVYRAVQELSQRPVVIKLLRQDYPNFNELLQFRNEYAITKNLNIPGIIHPLSLEAYANSYALVMEDFGGISLRDYTQNYSLSLGEFLEIARQIADILHDVCQHRVIHKDIKPANILIHPESQQVKLIDFSIASLLPRETQKIQNPNVLEGTLAYLSPEQTGRMNRGIDYRSDFYALGVTLYELLTGQLPFQSNDPMELVHCHLAKLPLAPHSINPEIPAIASEIVLKLMAKNAEDRYQSALGLKYDLECCLNQWKATGRIETFVLGKRDVCDRFIIPEKLYGRETEVANLLKAFERVANGSSEMMLVAGFSGIGKTVAINEVHKPIVRQRGYFIKGKYDQLQRNIPFSGFMQAFRDLMGQLLSESNVQLAAWKAKILAAVGENGQAIVDVIPELERIIGQQPPVPELSGNAAQNRFNLLFQKFIEVFTTPEHPLVMFLDDLQWADSASLNLLQLLIGEANSGYLLILGAYRDNEVFPTHPLILTLEQIQQAQATVNTIALQPLSEITVNQLVADTLSCPNELAQPLTQLVYQKTKGNPFFTTQFLKALYEEGCIQFQPELGYWQCDLASVRQLALTDGVVEFIALQLQKLPVDTQELLKLAACIGNQFDLKTLAMVCDKSLINIATNLWTALQEGLILPISETYKFFQSNNSDHIDRGSEIVVPYKFLHDRVQQTAYGLIPEDRKQSIHFQIGQQLWANTPEAEREGKIFEIVNQLNYGLKLTSQKSSPGLLNAQNGDEISRLQELDLAQLNLLAGQKAKAATAYEMANKYFTAGLAALPENGWSDRYDLTLALYTEAAEIEYLTAHFEQAERLSEIVLQHAQDLLQKVKMYEIKIYFYIAQNQMLAAIDICLQVLEFLGEPLFKEPPQELAIEDLINLPEMLDPHKLAAMRIAIAMVTPSLNAKPELLPLIAYTLVNLSIQFGNSAFSAFGYTFYGLVLCGTPTGIEKGYRFGQLGLKLLERFNERKLYAKVVNIFDVFVRHWQEPARKTIAPLREAIQVGLEMGDVEYACYNAASYCNYLFFIGEALEQVNQQQQKYIDLLLKFKQEYQIYFSQICRQLVLNLMGAAEDPLILVGDSFDEQKMLPILIETQNGTLLFQLHLAKTILLFIFEDYQQALIHAQEAEKYLGNMVGFLQFAEHNFYYSLALLATCSNGNEAEQQSALEKVAENQKLMSQWACHAPNNHQHKYDLVEAERAKILGHLDAITYYKKAIQRAKENDYIQEEALSNELAAKFYLACGKEKLAADYMQQAYYCYAHWGAKTKVAHLEEQYPQLLTAILQSPNIGITSTTTIPLTLMRSVTKSSSNQNLYLDLQAVMKAAQAISQEIELEKLLATLMQIAIANAGAQIGHLVLRQEEQWLVVAQAERELVKTLEIPLEQYSEIPQSLIYAVARTQETAVFEDLSTAVQFASDRYILTHQPKSVLCTPISRQGKLIGILYLENNLTLGAFTSDRIEILQLLTSQAAISVENARLYQQTENYSYTLEAEVEHKTQALNQKAQDLEQTLKKLQQTQGQLIHSEKMSSLGQLVAGIAHEINNPVNFIKGNLTHTENYIQDMMRLLTLYQQEYPQPNPAIQAMKEEIELDFLFKDANQTLESMKIGSDRISKIVQSLRNFARLDEAEIKAVDLHSGIESTLLILQHRLQASENQPEVRVIKEYGNLPLVTCYPSQLNQVFLNLINNAIDAIRDNPQSSQHPEIRIRTGVIDREWLRIAIANTDSSIPVNLQERIFEPFFTTKPIGRGQGLGLFVCYSIIQQHRGTLTVRSQPTEGTEFEIVLPIY